MNCALVKSAGLILIVRFTCLTTEKPLSQEKDIPRGRDIIYKKTYFERNRNLNGLECIRGMLSCMRDIPGREPIIKIDADTLLMSLEEIRKSLFERRKLAGGISVRRSIRLVRSMLLGNAEIHQ